MGRHSSDNVPQEFYSLVRKLNANLSTTWRNSANRTKITNQLNLKWIFLDYLDGPNGITGTLKTRRGRQKDGSERDGETEWQSKEEVERKVCVIQSLRGMWIAIAASADGGRGPLAEECGAASRRTIHGQEAARKWDLSPAIPKHWILPTTKKYLQVQASSEHLRRSTVRMAPSLRSMRLSKESRWAKWDLHVWLAETGRYTICTVLSR